jgi:pimeloyl-ACP methyl ester carboxylesterase
MKLIHANQFGEGKDLVIVHGFLGMGDNWKSLGKKWAASGYRVHLLDMRNHGRSFSMGGKVGMNLAIKKPDVLIKLVVVDIAPKFYPKHHGMILKGLELLEQNNLGSRKQADDLLSKTIDEVGIRQFLLKNLYRDEDNQLHLRINLKALKKNIQNIGEALADGAVYNGKTLFLKGEKSTYISNNDKRLIKKHFPNSDLKIIKNAGHWVHAEQPKIFYKSVNHFFNI